MSIINEHNYESFLLDHLEGNLSSELHAELVLFAELHPELDIDLCYTELTYLSAEENAFGDKESLKLIPRIELLAIGKIEGILEEKESAELASLVLQYPMAEKVLSSYEKTILPTETVVYPHKKALKKTVQFPLYFYYAAAAAAVIGFIAFFSVDTGSMETYQLGTHFAAVETINPIEVEIPSTNLATNVILEDTVSETPKNKMNNFPKNEDSYAGFLPQDKVVLAPSNTTVDTLGVKPKPFVDPKIITLDDPMIAEDVDTVGTPLIAPEEIADEPEIASNGTDGLTLKEFLLVKTKQVVLKDSEPTLDPISGNEILTGMVENLNTKSKSEVAFVNEKDDNKKVTKITLGKFEYYRSSSK